MHVWKVLQPPPFRRRDCGTGSGGFQPGNSCAGGEGGGTDEHSGSTESKRVKHSAQAASATLSESLKRINKLHISQEYKDQIKDLYEGPDGIQSFVENIEETMLAESARVPIDVGEHTSGLVRAALQNIENQIAAIIPDAVANDSPEHNELYKEITGAMTTIAKEHGLRLHIDDAETLLGDKKTMMIKTVAAVALGAVVSTAMFAENSESGLPFVAVPVFLNSKFQHELGKNTLGYYAPPKYPDDAYLSNIESLKAMERGHILVRTERTIGGQREDESPGRSSREGAVSKTMVHELMHARQVQTADKEDEYFKFSGGFSERTFKSTGAGWEERLTPAQKKMAQSEGLRDYAVSNSQEYLAGISEYLLSGKQITPAMWKLYDKYAGPPISPRLRKKRGGGKNPYRRGKFKKKP